MHRPIGFRGAIEELHVGIPEETFTIGVYFGYRSEDIGELCSGYSKRAWGHGMVYHPRSVNYEAVKMKFIPINMQVPPGLSTARQKRVSKFRQTSWQSTGEGASHRNAILDT
jgi:hypothetical protein